MTDTDAEIPKHLTIRHLIGNLMLCADSLDDPVAFVAEQSGQMAAFSGVGLFSTELEDDLSVVCVAIELDQAWSSETGEKLRAGAMTFLVDGDDGE